MLTIDLTLGVATVQETVQVTGESPLIDVKQNASFATMQKDVIDRIPKGRDFTSRHPDRAGRAGRSQGRRRCAD